VRSWWTRSSRSRRPYLYWSVRAILRSRQARCFLVSVGLRSLDPGRFEQVLRGFLNQVCAV
jgi:hypothetical protein